MDSPAPELPHVEGIRTSLDCFKLARLIFSMASVSVTPLETPEGLGKKLQSDDNM